jgi:hypothetical protein
MVSAEFVKTMISLASNVSLVHDNISTLRQHKDVTLKNILQVIGGGDDNLCGLA